MAFSFAFAIVIALFAPFLAFSFNRPELATITATLSLLFLAGAPNIQCLAILQRQMRLRAINLIQIAGLTTGALTAIFLALRGFGYSSLIALHISNEIVVTLLCILILDRRPAFKLEFRSIIPQLKFGGDVSIFNVLNTLALSIHQFIVGCVAGPQILGFYNRSYSLLEMAMRQFQAPLSQLIYSSMSKLQDAEKDFCQYFYRVFNMICYVWLPVMIIAFLFSKELIQILLGDQWGSANQFLLILAVVIISRPFYFTINWAFICLGKARFLKTQSITGSIFLVAMLFAGAMYGAIGIAIAYATGFNLLVALRLKQLFKTSSLQSSHLFRAIANPILFNTFLLFVLSFMKWVSFSWPVLQRLTFSIVIGTVFACLLSLSFPRVRGDLLLFRELLVSGRKRSG